jgi:hypothetical protein
MLWTALFHSANPCRLAGWWRAVHSINSGHGPEETKIIWQRSGLVRLAVPALSEYRECDHYSAA